MEVVFSETLILLFFVAILAGFLDTLAGGGGLITIPAIMLSGVAPLAALGTNKLQAFVGTGTATLVLLKDRKLIWREIKSLMLVAFIGSIIGTILVQFINPKILSFIIPAVLLIIAVYFIFSPKSKSTKPKLSQYKYKNLVVPIIGAYDGMFGPGTGSFFAMSGIIARGHNLITSTIGAKPLNFATNIASLLVFISVGQVVWLTGFAMMLGQMIGAWLGANSLYRVKEIYLRIAIVLMCIGMLVKYFQSNGWLNF